MKYSEDNQDLPNINILRNIKSFLSIKHRENIYNLYALAFAAGFGHIFFGLYWKYIDPSDFEIPLLRVIGFFSCVFLFLLAKNYHKLKNYRQLAEFYWFFTVTYNLPFFFTVSLIYSGYNPIWLAGVATMIFVVIMLFSGVIVPSASILTGVISAIFFCDFFGYGAMVFDQILIKIVPIYLLTIISAYIFSISDVLGFSLIKDAQFAIVSKSLKSLAGSIAHELRNPLNAVNLIGDQIKDTLSEDLNDLTKERLAALTAHIAESIVGANNIINIILSDLAEKPIAESDFELLKPNGIIPKIIENYGYKNLEEKKRIRLLIDQNADFIFNAVPERLTFIIYNLLKNALYYLREYPNSEITIGSEVRTIDNQNWNVIYVLDTGPGISKDNISKLFGDFYTSGKKEGTGLGLAFCKRNMKAFGGDIICESELGKWTKFSLLFPALSGEDLEKARLQILQKSSQEDNQDVKNTKAVSAESKTKILIVDDEKTNLLVTKSKIERNLQISCDLAHDGAEAVELVNRDIHKYHLVLMDIQMPEMNGVMAAQKIRAMNKNIPIIALTSLEYEDFENANLDNFNYYLNKPVAGHVLYRTINKFMPDTKDGLEYLGGQDQYLGELKGKKVLLADDQELNLKISSRKLRSVGMEIVEARDGKELLEIYKNSLSEGANNQLKSKFDLIITDINMPIMSGDEVISAIRKIERDSKISFKNRIPAIALTGDGDWDHINSFFKLGIDDYFVKGADSEKLIRTAALYLSPQKIYFNKHHLEQHKKMAQLQEGALQILNIEKMRYFNENDRKEFLKVFLEESALEIANIRNLQNSDKKVELSKSLHALKGICGNIGAEIIFSLIKELEKDLKDENLKNGWCEGLLSKYDDLEREIKKLFA